MDAIIKLFSANATSFATNGLGFLSETTSCEVHEELNGEFEMQMDYPLSGRLYSQIQLRSLIVVKPNPYDDPQAFRVYQISRPLNGLITINAHHISYDYSGIIVRNFGTASNISLALSYLKSNIIGNYSESFLNKIVLQKEGDFDDILFHHDTPMSLRASLGGEEESILAYYGGELKFNNYTVTVCKNRGYDRNVTIRYGKNLTAMDHKEDGTSKYDGIMPFWTITNENGYTSVEYCQYSNSIWGEGEPVWIQGIFYFNSSKRTNAKIFPLDVSSYCAEFPATIEEQNQMFLQATSNYISENNLENPIVSTTVSALILGQTTEHYGQIGESLEKVSLGDLVHIEYIEMGIHATAKCTATTYDVLTNKYTDMKLGEGSTSLADRIVNQQRKIDNSVTPVYVQQQASSASQIASDKISGNVGGFVILHSHVEPGQEDPGVPAGTPYEILIVDDPNLNSATKVWRWNQYGLGFSSNGYHGPYSKLALTEDGQIVASAITTGNLNGELITAGSVSASALSQTYKQSVVDNINNKAAEITQSFTAADNELRSSITAITQEGTGVIDTRMSSLRQDVNSLQIDFANVAQGGCNLLLNSSAINGLAYWRSNDPSHISIAVDSANTISGHYFKIPSGFYIFQTVNVIKGQNYSFSCKTMQEANGSSTISIVDGESVITIYSGSSSHSWTERTNLQIVPENSTITFMISSGANNFCVADMMFTQGAIKPYWTQAPTEVYTENIKMDQNGIHIVNNTSSTETLIDSTQFAIKNKDTQDTILTVNSTHTLLTKASVSTEFLIGSKGKFVPRDNGFDIVILD